MRGLLALRCVEQGGRDGRRAYGPILTGERWLFGATGFLLAAWHFDFPKVKFTLMTLQMMADSDQIVTPFKGTGGYYSTEPTCLTKGCSATWSVINLA
ncbi:MULTISPECIES: hypothetical protein [Phyllobacteriaceae]|uniref:hypothetical protein n=1 Tax=Phyllobacteriaceae TaxID=69277 RepID=UPI00139F2BB7|nr:MULTISPECIES: hypothetical protein [Mesorhizobium]MBN9234224.1 hypothetical protein [Mesorhizobium sp.]